jgi:hypothetical protein
MHLGLYCGAVSLGIYADSVRFTIFELTLECGSRPVLILTYSVWDEIQMPAIVPNLLTVYHANKTVNSSYIFLLRLMDELRLNL